MPVDSTTEPYRDASRPVDERVDDLIGRMTLPEKIAQLGCVWITSLVHSDRFDADAAAARIPDGIGQVTRIGASTGLRPAASAALMNEIQRVVVERTRLGIPVVVHEESVGGFCAREATVFPQGIGLASSWDPDLVCRVATVIREQMLAVGARHTLAPVLDVARDPRWGRVEETYGEDPVLAGTIGTAYVRGMQSDDLGTGVVATGKHFLGYAIAEGGLNWAPVQLGPRELREVYAEPFAAAIRDAGLASIMNSYSSVDGLPCGGAAAILTGLLRDELGFDGLVVADYGTVALLETHHRTASDKASAAAQALNAGLDVELPALDCFASLPDALDQGLVTMPVIDQAVRRVLRCKFRLGLFEQPYVDADAAAGAYQTVAQRALTREAATASLVLLSNPSGVLPLTAGLRRIAVIGPGADDERLLQGDYHYPAHLEIVYEKQADDTSGTALDGSTGTQFLPESGGAFQAGPYYTPHITPLAGIRSRAGDGVEIVHVRGCDVSSNEGAEIDEAAAAAAAADVAIVVVAGRSGLRPLSTVGEARDATNLDLTGLQPQLVEAVAATGTPTVVVVLSGRVHSLASVADQAAALVQAWPLGEEGGSALADVLFGAANPSGRLPVSLPRSVGQVPVYAGHRAGGGKSMFYLDYTDSPATPLFAFGHGLSYTSFSYAGLTLESGSTTDPVTVTITVTNDGDRPGAEVVQLYACDLVASTARPDHQLVGFAKLTLDASESATARFTVHPSRLAFYDPAMRFVVEPGEFVFRIGASSVDIRHEATVDLTGDVAEYRQRDVVATSVAVS